MLDAGALRAVGVRPLIVFGGSKKISPDGGRTIVLQPERWKDLIRSEPHTFAWSNKQ